MKNTEISIRTDHFKNVNKMDKIVACLIFLKGHVRKYKHKISS